MVAGGSFKGADLGPARVAVALAGLSPPGRLVVTRAYTEAYSYASDFVGSAHLLLGLVADSSSALTSAIHDSGTVTVETVRRQFEQTTGERMRASPRHVHLIFSPHAKAVLIDAADHAREAGSAMTEIDHLWLAVSRADGAVARHILSGLGRLCHLQRLCAEVFRPDVR